MTATPDSLQPHLRDDPNVEPPYSSSQISETAIHREILRIYEYARRETKMVYDLGRDTAGIEEENWVIRWMLWHVFRYRDNRNKNRRTASPPDEPDSAGGASPDGAASKTPQCKKPQSFGTVARLTSPSATTTSTSRYWDPVRNG
jgi:hypothetical protein